MAGEEVTTGGCECGRVRYTARAVPGAPAWCYCKQCQRLSGAPFLAFADFKKTDIQWSTAADVFKSSEIAERDYCKECGSTIGMRYHFQPDSLGVTLGTIDKECNFSKRASYHIFLKDKPAWFTVPEDGAPRFEGHNTDNGFLQQMGDWEDRQRKTT